jgi:Bacterial Ig-like domain (group 2)/Putative binding domain, N-terminal
MRRLVAVLILASAACSPSKPASPPTTPTPTAATVSGLSVTGPGCVEGVCSGQVGGTVQLSARATLSDSTTQDVTAQAQWSSANASVASVSGGLVTFHAAGDADIAATFGGFSARQTMRLISCGYAPPGVPAFDAVGGSGAVSVATASGCHWTVASNDPWIRIGERGPFAGPLAVAFTIDPNRSFGGRAGSIVVKSDSGETLAAYAVSQRAAGCLYSISPATITINAMGTNDGAGESPLYVKVHAEPANCEWTATPAVPWMALFSASYSRGTGDRSIGVMVGWNFGGPTKTGDVVIAGLSGVNPDARLTVTQTGSTSASR